MSHEVRITHIGEISTHPNADRLDLARIDNTDWQVVVGRDQFKVGDLCVYIPIDSVLPAQLEEFLFPPDSKVTLSKSRVRSIKIRGAISQGMVIELDYPADGSPNVLRDMYPGLYTAPIGTDVGELMGIAKYEPPLKSFRGEAQGKSKRKGNPDFTKYTDIENLKNYPGLFKPEDQVYVTEKIHGTSVRYALLPVVVDTPWKWLRRLVGMLPAHEFCYGSRNVQLHANRGKVYYSKNVYAIIATKLQILSRLAPGETLYGEIVGAGIQKGYTYGCGEGEWDFYAYDVKRFGKFLDYEVFKDWCMVRGVKRVPELYVGPLEAVDLDYMRSGPSVIDDAAGMPVQKVREGIVVKPVVEERSHIGRKVLKYLNDEYLLDKTNTDFH